MVGRVALDTNILVSAAVFRGPEKRLVTAGLQGMFTLLVPRSVLVEAEDVLRRDFPGVTDASGILAQIAEIAVVVEDEAAAAALPRALALIRDSTDAPVLAALLADPPEFLVTGDKDFLVLDGSLPFRVLRTGAMLALLERR